MYTKFHQNSPSRLVCSTDHERQTTNYHQSKTFGTSSDLEINVSTRHWFSNLSYNLFKISNIYGGNIRGRSNWNRFAHLGVQRLTDITFLSSGDFTTEELGYGFFGPLRNFTYTKFMRESCFKNRLSCRCDNSKALTLYWNIYYLQIRHTVTEGISPTHVHRYSWVVWIPYAQYPLQCDPPQKVHL